MAIYISPRAAAANAGAYRRPTGVTEQFVPRRLLPDWEREMVPSPWPTLSKQCQVMPNPLSFTYEPLSLSSRTCVSVFARLWAEIRLKGQTLVGGGSSGIVRALLYSHNLRKRTERVQISPPPSPSPWQRICTCTLEDGNGRVCAFECRGM